MNISLIGILTSLAMGGTLPDDSKTQQQVAQVSTHILPNIAGQWQLRLDKTDAAQKDRAYRMLMNRKFSEEAASWMQEQRASAYVKILSN